MHTARHPACRFTLFACHLLPSRKPSTPGWAPTTRTVKALYRFTVDPQTGALNDKTLVSKLPNAAQLTVSHDGKTLYLRKRSGAGRGAGAAHR